MALAGTFAGASLGAARSGAPRQVRIGFLVLAGVSIVVAALLLASRR